jgi:hypothetical protein
VTFDAAANSRLQRARSDKRLRTGMPRDERLAVIGDGSGNIWTGSGDHVWVRLAADPILPTADDPVVIARNLALIEYVEGDIRSVQWMSDSPASLLKVVDRQRRSIYNEQAFGTSFRQYSHFIRRRHDILESVPFLLYASIYPTPFSPIRSMTYYASGPYAWARPTIAYSVQYVHDETLAPPVTFGGVAFGARYVGPSYVSPIYNIGGGQVSESNPAISSVGVSAEHTHAGIVWGRTDGIGNNLDPWNNSGWLRVEIWAQFQGSFTASFDPFIALSSLRGADQPSVSSPYLLSPAYPGAPGSVSPNVGLIVPPGYS